MDVTRSLIGYHLPRLWFSESIPKSLPQLWQKNSEVNSGRQYYSSKIPMYTLKAVGFRSP